MFNVSEFENIDEATKALTSTSQAFKELDKMEIVDVINKIGNEYSIATDELATGLQDTAAALVTQGNDLYKSVALVTAGNAITQNASKTAGGVRTISLRIAGTEAAKDELASLGDDVDDFVVRTKSKTQELIKGYTAVKSNAFRGVDVLDDNGNLRDTYNILLDIAKVYKEIQEEDKQAGTNRANALVEAIAGKNRSNIASSILLNPEMLESVYESAHDASGSALAENEKFLDSIEGKMQQLSNAGQKFWEEFLDGEMLKSGIGFLTKIVDLFTKLTSPAGIAGLSSLIVSFRKFSKLKSNLSTSSAYSGAEQIIQDYNNLQQKSAITPEHFQSWSQTDRKLGTYLTGLNGAPANMTVYNASLKTSFKGLVNASRAIKDFNVLQSEGIEVQRSYANVVGNTNVSLGDYLKGLQGASGSMSGYAISLGKATLKTAGLQIATIGLQSVLSLGISGLITLGSHWIHKEDEMAEKAKQAADNINELTNSLRSNVETVETSKQRYAELAQEVENLGRTTQNKGSLSNDEYKEFLDLSNQLVEKFPALLRSYDDNGNAILNLSGDVDTLVKSFDELIKKEKQAANIKMLEELPTAWQGYVAKLSNKKGEGLNKDLGRATRYRDAALEIKEALEHSGKFFLDNYDGNTNVAKYKNDVLKRVLGSIGEELSEYESVGALENVVDLSSLSEDDIDKLRYSLAEIASEYENTITDVNYQIQTVNTQMANAVNSWLSTNSQFLNLSSDLQNVVNRVFSDGTWIENLPDDIDKSNWNEVRDYLQSSFLSSIQKIDDGEIKTQLLGVLDGEFTVENIQGVIDKLLGSKGFDKDNPLILYLEAQKTEKQEVEDLIRGAISKANTRFKTTEAKDQHDEVKKELEKYNKEDTIDFTVRPVIDDSKLATKGWGEATGNKATVASVTRYSEDFDLEAGRAIVVTPILPNGEVLTEEEVDEYILKMFNGEEIDVDIKMGEFDGKNYKEEASNFANTIHELHDKYFLDDNYVDWGKYFKDQSIDTQEEVKKWNEVTKYATSAAGAMELWEASNKKAEDSVESLAKTIESINEAFELFNEVNSDYKSTGVISSENIQKIAEKFPELEVALTEYIMGLRTGSSVIELLKAKSDDMASVSTEAFRKMYMSSDVMSKGIKSQFAAAFKAVGIGWDNTRSIMANVNSQIIDANGNVCETFAEQWNTACQLAGASVSLVASSFGNLLSGSNKNIKRVDGKLIATDELGGTADLVNTTVHQIRNDIKENGKKSTYWDTYGDIVDKTGKGGLYNVVNNHLQGIFNNNEKTAKELEEGTKRTNEQLKELAKSSVSGSKDGGSGDKAGYESPVDAIINGIEYEANRIQNAVDQYDKSLELIDSEKDPERYSSIVQKKIDELKSLSDVYTNAQAKFHNEAERIRQNSGYDIENWFDDLGNATVKYYDDYNAAKSSTEQQNIKSLFDDVKKYKDAWTSARDSQHNALKSILDSEKELVSCLERELEITKTIAKAHNDSYSNQKTVIEREISDIEHLIELSQDTSETADLRGSLVSVYKRGMSIADTNMQAEHSDAEYWRNKLKEVLTNNGHNFDVSSWFAEDGAILSQFEADMNAITDDIVKAEIQAYTDTISEKKSTYMDFYEWRLELEKNVHEAAKDYLSDLKDAANELFDLRKSKLDSEKTLLGEHYDLINSIREEQHNLDKELLEAETIGARMSENERDLLFSKEDHAVLSSKLNKILGEANALQKQYQRSLSRATKNTIEEITKNYERQYELKLKEYEIVQAELDVAMAEQKLENVKNEKSVRTWNGNQWVYEAVLQDVLDAQNEVEDAKYKLEQTKLDNEQQKALNKLSAQSDALTTEQNKFADALAQLSGETTNAREKLTNALENIADTDLELFSDILDKVGKSLSKTFDVSVSKKSSSKSYGKGVAFVLDTKNGTWTDVRAGTTKPAAGYAKGAKSTKSGLGLFDEEGDGSEVIVTKYGKLRQFSAGETVFNKQATDRLYDLATNDYRSLLPNAVQNIPSLPQISQPNTSSQDNRVYSINGITVQDDKGRELFKEIANYIWKQS